MAANETTRCVIIVPLVAGNHIDEDARLAFQRELSQLFGSNNMRIGREFASSNEIRQSVEIIPFASKEVAANIGEPKYAGHSMWIGDNNIVAGAAGEQLVAINLDVDAYLPNMPIGDWPLISKVFEWLEFTGLATREFYYGTDLVAGGVKLVNRGNIDEMNTQFFFIGRGHHFEDASGKCTPVTPRGMYAEAMSCYIDCVVCGNQMTPSEIIDGCDAFECTCCGERCKVIESRESVAIISPLGRNGTEGGRQEVVWRERVAEEIDPRPYQPIDSIEWPSSAR